MGEAEKAYSTPLEGIFPSKTDEKDDKDIDMPLYKAELPLTAPVTIARPRVSFRYSRALTANMTAHVLLKTPVLWLKPLLCATLPRRQ